ncbi:MAG: replication factor C large subunit [Nanoarchaeota archaeon]|nr:replication factor C large subunit [Nanoarchaeota archaeon]
MLTHKYTPKSTKQIIGRDQEIKKLLQCIQQKKPVIIYGPTGVGKTCSVHAISREKDYEILETNASDLRNKEQIESRIGHSSKQASLFAKEKIILVDELDGINKKDFGGLAALNKLIDESAHSIVLTTNDVWDSKFKELRKKCELIEFQKLGYLELFNILKEIIKAENFKISDSTLKMLARKCNGDTRSAINDLELIIHGGEAEAIDYRERVESIFNTLRMIFKGKEIKATLGMVDSIEENLDELLLWLDENLPREYAGETLAKAYDNLSLADVYRGRIRRRQYYRYLVYQKLLMTLGVAFAKKEKQSTFTNYKRSTRPLKIWLANRKNAQRKALAQEISEQTHMSGRKVMNEMPYMRFLEK